MACEDEKNELFAEEEMKTHCMVFIRHYINDISNISQICQENISKYKCPCCSILTCCCACVKAHKVKVSDLEEEEANMLTFIINLTS
jgi:hypothetical protein